MKPSTRRLLLLIPLGFFLMLLVLYLAVDKWLESAGGRHALERAISDRIGMDVKLQGDFNIMLLPAIGVSGTNLEISAFSAGEPVARAGRYEIVVALGPLIDKRVRVDNFVLESLQLTGPGEGTGQLGIERVEFREFEKDKPTPFSVTTTELGNIEGEFRWMAGDSVLATDFEWRIEGAGVLNLRSSTSLVNYSGSLAASYLAPGSEQVINASTNYEYRPDKITLTELGLESVGQEAGGSGCLWMGGLPSLNLNLVADFLDLDELRTVAPGSGAGVGELPLEVRIRLTAQEVRTSGVIAREVAFRLGGEPSCEVMESPAADRVQ